jgi:hypothetical protein
MTHTAAELIARANDATQSLLGEIAADRPVGILDPAFLRQLRARRFILDDAGQIRGFRVDPYANKIYLGREVVEGIQVSFAGYCTSDDTVHVPHSDLVQIPAAQQDAFTSAMVDIFFALFMLHETLHETQGLTSYNYHQTDSFINSIRRIDYVADQLSIVSMAHLLRRSGTDWAAALMVSDRLATVLRLIQVHCYGMAYFARLAEVPPKLTKSSFYRLMTWHIQFHRTSAITRQRRDPLPLLDQEPIFDALACDQLSDAVLFTADRLIAQIDLLRQNNPPPENLSILVQPPGSLPILRRFNGSSQNSLEGLIRGIYSSSFRLTEPFLFELFNAVPELLVISDGGRTIDLDLVPPSPPVSGGGPSLTFAPISLAGLEIAAKEPSDYYRLRLWGDPTSGYTAFSVQGDLMEIARDLPECAEAVHEISRAFSGVWLRNAWSEPLYFATKLRISAPVRVINPADVVAVLHIPEQRERTLSDAAESIKYRVLTEGPCELGPSQSRMLTLEVSLYLDEPTEPEPLHFRSVALMQLRFAKALRDRAARAAHGRDAIPIKLDIIDMDGSPHELTIALQIVEGLKELPEWHFDLSALEQAFRTIDKLAVPAYREKVHALARDNEKFSEAT